MAVQQGATTISSPVSVSTWGATAASAADGTATKSNVLGKDDFLKILMTQLKYQDPMSPADPSQFMNQLSQLTQVEQLQNMAASLNDLKSIASQGSASQWLSTIGRRIKVEDNLVSLGDQVGITPAGDYDKITLSLRSETDGSIKEVTYSKGETPVYTSDSTDTYLAGATATKDGKPVGLTLTLYRVVRGVQTDDSGLVLVAGDGTPYAASSVKLIKE
jgi:flagellar hook assembly protein FlgD